MQGQGRLGQFGRVDIDHDRPRVPRERRPIVADLPDVEPAAQHQDQIGVLNDEITRPIADRARPARVERVGVGQQVMGVPPGHHRRAESLDERVGRRQRPREPHARPGHDHRPLSAGEFREDGRDHRLQRRSLERVLLTPRVRRDGRVGFVVQRVEALQRVGLDHGALDIAGHIHPDGSRSPPDAPARIAFSKTTRVRNGSWQCCRRIW